jgi:DNA-binding NarL/FixJ family response regulator
LQIVVSDLVERSPRARLRSAADHGPKAARRARVMIVEDDYLVAMEVEDRLNEAGFEIVGTAKSVTEAVALAATEQPEIAIMDIRILGSGDGIDAAVELRSRFDIPSVFASAHVDPDTIARAAPARPLGWVSKPYSIATIIDLLNRVLPPSQTRN